MKRLLLLLSFVFSFSIIGFAQSNSTIDVMMGGEYTFRLLNFSKEASQLVSSDIYNRDDGFIIHRFGFNFNHELFPNFYLKTGIRYTEGGFKYDFPELIFVNQYESTSGVIIEATDPALLNYPDYNKNSYLFLEFPIIGRYEYKTTKFSPFIEAGISPNIYLNTKLKTVYPSGSDRPNTVEYQENELLKINTLQFVASISFGYNYHLNDSFTIYGQPIIRYHLTALADTPVKYYLYNIGLELGLRKNLGVKKDEK